nr:hypothetical protein [Actinoplanes teichomyceticus]
MFDVRRAAVRPGFASAVVGPGPQRLARLLRDRHRAELIALAVQPQRAGALRDDPVTGVEAGALLDTGAAVEQHRDDRRVAGVAGVAGAAATGAAFDLALLRAVQGVRRIGRGTRGRSTFSRMPAPCS